MQCMFACSAREGGQPGHAAPGLRVVSVPILVSIPKSRFITNVCMYVRFLLPPIPAPSYLPPYPCHPTPVPLGRCCYKLRDERRLAVAKERLGRWEAVNFILRDCETRNRS